MTSWWCAVVLGCVACRADFDPLVIGGDGGADAPVAAARCDPTDPHQIACYRFDGDLLDGSSGGNDLVASQVVSYVAGIDGTAVRSGGTLDLHAPDRASLHARTGLSIEAWARAETLPAGAAKANLVDKDGSYALILLANATLHCAVVINAVHLSTDVPAAVSAGQWHHLGCTYDGSALVVYVDGVARGSTSVSGSIDVVMLGFSVGQNSPSGEPFDGELDDVRMWDTPLPASQICRDAGACP